MHRVRVRSLVGELGSHMRYGQKQPKNINGNNTVTNPVTTLKNGTHQRKSLKKKKKKCDEVLYLLKHKKTQSIHFKENENTDFLTSLLQGQNFM